MNGSAVQVIFIALALLCVFFVVRAVVRSGTKK